MGSSGDSLEWTKAASPLQQLSIGVSGEEKHAAEKSKLGPCLEPDWSRSCWPRASTTIFNKLQRRRDELRDTRSHALQDPRRPTSRVSQEWQPDFRHGQEKPANGLDPARTAEETAFSYDSSALQACSRDNTSTRRRDRQTPNRRWRHFPSGTAKELRKHGCGSHWRSKRPGSSQAKEKTIGKKLRLGPVAQAAHARQQLSGHSV